MNSKFRTIAITLSLFLLVLLAFGTVSAKKYSTRGPWIGVYTQSIDEDIQEAFDLDQSDGIVIVDIVDDSPADDAGLRRKDIIIEFNGNKIDNSKSLISYVSETKIGDEVEIVYLRKGKKKTATVEIGRRPRTSEFDISLSPGALSKSYARSLSHSRSLFSDSYIGVAIQDLNEQLGEYFGVEDGEGVLVTEVFEDSPAEDAGMKAGDVIISADGEKTTETIDLQDIISDKEEGDEVVIEYLRKGIKETVTIEVAEDYHGMSAFTLPHLNFSIPSMPSLPSFRGFGYSVFDDDEDDEKYFEYDEYKEAMEDYKEAMKELKQELQEMKKELGEIKKKLE